MEVLRIVEKLTCTRILYASLLDGKLTKKFKDARFELLDRFIYYLILYSYLTIFSPKSAS